MKITDALIAEHGCFHTILDFVENILPTLDSLGEVKLLSALIDKLLRSHSEIEDQFVMPALDHTLEEQRQYDSLHQVHLEIDGRLKEVQTATQISTARQLLKAVIVTTRKHFIHEEASVFPLAEKFMKTETLQHLGEALREHRRPSNRAQL